MTEQEIKYDAVDSDGDTCRLALLVKGWGHNRESLVKLWVRECEYEPCDDPLVIREVWIRKRPAVEMFDYAWTFDFTKPHARGAGKFTWVTTEVTK